MKLFKFYSTDECTNEKTLFEKLDNFKKEGKIDYETIDRWTIKVTDIDLSIDEEKETIELFDKLDLYPINNEEDDNTMDEADYGDYEDDGSDYRPSVRNNHSYNDENDY